MLEMSLETRAFKEPQSTFKSSPQDTHKSEVGAVINLGVDNEGRVGRETHEEDEEVVRART